jgi:hypothetical protein
MVGALHEGARDDQGERAPPDAEGHSYPHRASTDLVVLDADPTMDAAYWRRLRVVVRNGRA